MKSDGYAHESHEMANQSRDTSGLLKQTTWVSHTLTVTNETEWNGIKEKSRKTTKKTYFIRLIQIDRHYKCKFHVDVKTKTNWFIFYSRKTCRIPNRMNRLSCLLANCQQKPNVMRRIGVSLAHRSCLTVNCPMRTTCRQNASLWPNPTNSSLNFLSSTSK